MTKIQEMGLKTRTFLFDNIVMVLFVVFAAVGIFASEGLPFSFFANELLSRFFRNGFLVLALVSFAFVFTPFN